MSTVLNNHNKKFNNLLERDKKKYIMNAIHNYDLEDSLEFIRNNLDKVSDNNKILCFHGLQDYVRNKKDLSKDVFDKVLSYLEYDSDEDVDGQAIETIAYLAQLNYIYRKDIFMQLKQLHIDYFEGRKLTSYKMIDISNYKITDESRIFVNYILNFCQTNPNYEERIVLCSQYINSQNSDIINAIMQGLTYIVVEENKIEWQLFENLFKESLNSIHTFVYTEGLLYDIVYYISEHRDKAVKLLEDTESCILQNYGFYDHSEIL